MYDYQTIMIARKEYEQRVESLAPVQDFDASWHHERPSLGKKFGHVLCALGAGLAAVGQSLAKEPVSLEDPRLMASESGEA